MKTARPQLLEVPETLRCFIRLGQTLFDNCIDKGDFAAEQLKPTDPREHQEWSRVWAKQQASAPQASKVEIVRQILFRVGVKRDLPLPTPVQELDTRDSGQLSSSLRRDQPSLHETSYSSQLHVARKLQAVLGQLSREFVWYLESDFHRLTIARALAEGFERGN